MKGYVVTLMNLDESVKVADRCIESGKQFGIDIEYWYAINKQHSLKVIAGCDLSVSNYDQQYSVNEAVLANFMSQYLLWSKICMLSEPTLILEHDAVITAPIPEYDYEGITNIGKPSYGQYKIKNKVGIYPMFSKVGGYIPGAHAYIVSPEGAKELVKAAKRIGAAPVDLFLNKTTFPNIKEIYPWVAEAQDSFTTIQKAKGCEAKHNYDGDYRIL